VVAIFGGVWWCIALCTHGPDWFFFFFLSVQVHTVADVGSTVRCPVINGMVCRLQLVASIRFSSFYLGRGVRERWCIAHPCPLVWETRPWWWTSSRGPPTKHVVCIRRTAPGPARALFGLEAAVALVLVE